MPNRPAQACPVYGCPNLEPCPLHGYGRAAWRARIGTAHARGYDARWQRFREWYFGELWRLQVPRAALCGCRHPSAPATEDSECTRTNAPEFATVVDHIVPIQGKDDPRFYDLANMQGLCKPCHEKKRRREADRAKR